MEMRPPVKNSLDTFWKILIIDDDEDDYILTREMLREARGRKYDVHWAATYDAGKKELLADHYNAVLVDYDLGVHSGIELIRQANGWGYTAPLILFTGRGNYEVDVEAMEAGATLYLSKGEANPLLLERAVRYAIELKQKELKLRQNEAQLRAGEIALRTSEARLRGFLDNIRVRKLILLNNSLRDHLCASSDDAAEDYLKNIQSTAEQMHSIITALHDLAISGR